MLSVTSVKKLVEQYPSFSHTLNFASAIEIAKLAEFDNQMDRFDVQIKNKNGQYYGHKNLIWRFKTTGNLKTIVAEGSICDDIFQNINDVIIGQSIIFEEVRNSISEFLKDCIKYIASKNPKWKLHSLNPKIENSDIVKYTFCFTIDTT